MQPDAYGARMRPFAFNTQAFNDLIERGLSCSVTIPAAQTVIPDGADARGQGGKDRPPLSRHQAQRVFQHHNRANSVDRILPRQGIGVQRFHCLFRFISRLSQLELGLAKAQQLVWLS